MRKDNALTHNALSVEQYLAAYFFKFPKIKSTFKITRYELIEKVKQKSAELLQKNTSEIALTNEKINEWRNM